MARADDAYTHFGRPVEALAAALQQERRDTVAHIVSPRSSTAAMRRDQQATDRLVEQIQNEAGGSHINDLDSVQRDRLNDVLATANGMEMVRRQTVNASVAWEDAIQWYTDAIAPTFLFRTSFTARQTGQIARQSAVVVELTRAREYLSQEDAALVALRRTPRPTQAQIDMVSNSIRAHGLIFDIYGPELAAEDSQLYDDLTATTDWTQLQIFESLYLAYNGPGDHSLSTVTGPVLNDLATLDSRLSANVDRRASANSWSLLRQGIIAGTAGLLAVLASLLLSVRIGRSLVRELLTLRNAAQETAEIRLPKVMRLLRRGEPVDAAQEAPPLELGTLREIKQVGRAFDAVQRAAMEAAVEQAELRRGVSAVFVNLARRSQVLLHRQLTLLDTMERRTEDPAELADLFRLDHLTTRMRRHAEGLIILSGGSPGRNWRRPVRMVDVVRAAVGEVEDYARVTVRPLPGTALVGPAVADVTHLIAELVENATLYSPPHTQVTVHGEVVANGFALEVDDRGLGMGTDALTDANRRLSEEQEFDLTDTDRLGLFVVSRLARRHGVKVSLRPSPYGGTTAVLLIPRDLLADGTEQPTDTAGGSQARPGAGRELVPVPSPAPDPDGSATAGAEQGGRSGPHPVAAEPAPVAGGLPRRRTNPVLAPVPAEPVAEPVEEPAGGLPQRVRQASLAPQLRAAVAESAETAAPAVRERSPEAARATFASFQRGLDRGRGTAVTAENRRTAPSGDSAPDVSVEGKGR
ncbi:nitrate- and nitrite sensing domain-containing protein [Peterkaempfera sp. SMS 1(5)a]|uniref:sensor histidine kinase n=1 Tax=Peterkaempfera podocarpi TaxID=3232308 RepID=UPI003671101F